jgi:hypothetical protein
MVKWLVWQLEDLAVYIPLPIRRWYHWHQLNRRRRL